MRIRRIGDVGMEFASKLTEGALDLALARPAPDSKQLVVVVVRRSHLFGM
jgi:hypothetical protein